MQYNNTSSQEVLAAVDNCIKLLSKGRNSAEEAACVKLICALLARLQIFLDQHYYRQHEEQKAALLAGIRVFVLTPTKLAEIRNGDSEWSFLFTGEQKWGLLVDEYHQCMFLEASYCDGNWIYIHGFDR